MACHVVFFETLKVHEMPHSIKRQKWIVETMNDDGLWSLKTLRLAKLAKVENSECFATPKTENLSFYWWCQNVMTFRVSRKVVIVAQDSLSSRKKGKKLVEEIKYADRVVVMLRETFQQKSESTLSISRLIKVQHLNSDKESAWIILIENEETHFYGPSIERLRWMEVVSDLKSRNLLQPVCSHRWTQRKDPKLVRCPQELISLMSWN